jgi:hypothetical protein
VNRRGFLAALGTLAAGTVAHELDLDKLLWRPGAKKIFLPSTTVMRSPGFVGPDLGISIRFVRQFDITADMMPTRMDVFYGIATLRPDYAVRIHSDEASFDEAVYGLRGRIDIEGTQPKDVICRCDINKHSHEKPITLADILQQGIQNLADEIDRRAFALLAPPFPSR